MLILPLIDMIESVIARNAYDNSSEDQNILQEFNYLDTLRVNKQGTNK